MLMFNFCTETFGSCKNMTRHSVNEKIKSFFLKFNDKILHMQVFFKNQFHDVMVCSWVKKIVCRKINRLIRFKI